MQQHPSDLHLWQAFHEDRTPERAWQIVEHHRGFIVNYARETGFPYWPAWVRDDYLQELLLAAVRLVFRYDPTRTGHQGKTASFPTWFRRSAQHVRWDVDRNHRSGPTQSRRGRKAQAACDLVVATMWADGVTPTPELVRERLLAGGHEVGVSTVAGWMEDRPRGAVSGDRAVGEDSQVWDAIPVWDPDPWEVEERAAEIRDASSTVRHLVAALGDLSDLERTVLEERLLAEDPVPLAELPDGARQVERQLMRRLRSVAGGAPELPFSA